jgi:hypothetical protein
LIWRDPRILGHSPWWIRTMELARPHSPFGRSPAGARGGAVAHPFGGGRRQRQRSGRRLRPRRVSRPGQGEHTGAELHWYRTYTGWLLCRRWCRACWEHVPPDKGRLICSLILLLLRGRRRSLLLVAHGCCSCSALNAVQCPAPPWPCHDELRAGAPPRVRNVSLRNRNW